jgi:hypothetical protein
MLAHLLAGVLIVGAWIVSGSLGYIWYKRIETTDSQVPEPVMIILLGPFGLGMLILHSIFQGVFNLAKRLGGK